MQNISSSRSTFEDELSVKTTLVGEGLDNNTSLPKLHTVDSIASSLSTKSDRKSVV